MGSFLLPCLLLLQVLFTDLYLEICRRLCPAVHVLVKCTVFSTYLNLPCSTSGFQKVPYLY